MREENAHKIRRMTAETGEGWQEALARSHVGK
jgi:hypothetical protein